MKQHIENLLQELYAIDPDLRQRETEIRKIIERFIELKPQVAMDRAARRALKEELLQQFSQQTQQAATSSRLSLFFTHMNSLKFAATGVGVVVLVAVGALYMYYQQSPQVAQEALFTGETRIVDAGRQAFGSLASLQQSAAQGLGAGAPAGFGGGGGGKIESSVADTSMPRYYNPVKYTFRYVGDDITVPGEEVTVYKREINQGDTSSLQRLVNQVNLGLLDLKSFDNMRMQSISLYEDKDFGYSLHIDVPNAMISISEYWQGWMTPDRTCTSQECFEQNRLRPEDMPADARLIELATEFLQDHNIAIDNYGTPKVADEWRVYYAQAVARGEDAYVPEIISVVFPEVINGTTVYDEGGQPTGLMVSVNVRHQKVSGAWNITTRNYAQSDYAAVTDTQAIINYVEQGAQFGTYYPEENATEIVLNVGTPELRLVKVYQYENGTSAELYVPSLVFPVTPENDTQEPTYMYVPQELVVPLEQEMFSQRQDYLPPIRPLAEPAVEPAVLEAEQTSVEVF